MLSPHCSYTLAGVLIESLFAANHKLHEDCTSAELDHMELGLLIIDPVSYAQHLVPWYILIS